MTCHKKIKPGETFKLLPHKKAESRVPAGEMRDEMCCARCGEPELLKRDSMEEKERQKRYYGSSRKASFVGGYSRTSKT